MKNSLLTIFVLIFSLNAHAQSSSDYAAQNTCRIFIQNEAVKETERQISALSQLTANNVIYNNSDYNKYYRNRRHSYLDNEFGELAKIVESRIENIISQKINGHENQQIEKMKWYAQSISELMNCDELQETELVKYLKGNFQLDRAYSIAKLDLDFLKNNCLRYQGFQKVECLDRAEFSQKSTIEQALNDSRSWSKNSAIASFTLFRFPDYSNILNEIDYTTINEQFSKKMADFSHFVVTEKSRLLENERQAIYAKYNNSPDALMDGAIEQFIKIQRCHEVDAQKFMPINMYQNSQAKIRQIESKLKGEIKESISKKWNRLNSSVKFTARSLLQNHRETDEIVELVCTGARITLDKIFFATELPNRPRSRSAF